MRSLHQTLVLLLLGITTVTAQQCYAGQTSDWLGGCVSCSAGSYKNITGPDACTYCPTGTYSITVGATTEATCIGCAVDTYSATLGASDPGTCLGCPANTSSLSGSGHIVYCKCLAGYTGADGTACEACPTGSYKAGTGTGSCIACPSGTISLATYCTCNVGYTAASDDVTCTACEAGTYKTVTGAFMCQPCPTGTSSSTGSDALTNCICQAGYAAAVDGTVCTACTVGQFKASTGVGQCTGCTARMTSVEPGTECIQLICTDGMHFGGEDVCTDCPSNTYCIGGNLTACPTNKISDTGSATCSCISGYY
jgi:Tyrosine-protein kinase ephrin type A/B receptor-like